MWIKICGITRLEDACLVEQMGADAIGFIFTKSPRQIDVTTAAQISKHLHFVSKVGVFVNQSIAEVQEIRQQCELDVVQLHGDESPEFCQSVGGTVIKSFRLKDKSTLHKIKDYSKVWKILLDAYVPGKMGGTGKSINIKLVREIKDCSRIILAGGLNPGNVAAITGELSPFGIDVSSGVEQSPGIKDPQKLEQLFQAVK